MPDLFRKEAYCFILSGKTMKTTIKIMPALLLAFKILAVVLTNPFASWQPACSVSNKVLLPASKREQK